MSLLEFRRIRRSVHCNMTDGNLPCRCADQRTDPGWITAGIELPKQLELCYWPRASLEKITSAMQPANAVKF